MPVHIYEITRKSKFHAYIYIMQVQQTGQIIAICMVFAIPASPCKRRVDKGSVSHWPTHPIDPAERSTQAVTNMCFTIHRVQTCSKTNLSWRFFCPTCPPPRSYFRLFFQRGYLEHSRTPFCKMQYIFWVHDLPLAHLKRTCLARAIESMLQLVQKRGLFSLCSM